ncbi:hypothetical protein [Mariniflexile sp. HMF6888]|uniref:hypothetical protein n=1 Tax=Mariniflexile sp. HMF6888 TaxID=3373086 RepID=UPI0037B525EC
MINKEKIYGLFQLLIIFLITIFVESVANGELLFTKGILDEQLRKDIVSRPVVVLCFLGFINLLLYYLSHRNIETKEKTRLHDNICQLIFDGYIKPNTTLENSKFRVSTFKAKKMLILKRDKYYLPQYRTVLVNVGRYQTRQEKKRCKVKFLPDEGVVGTCYSIGEFLFDEVTKYEKNTKENYYKEQESKLNLPIFKSKRLNDKSCSYICCPIKYFKHDDLYGVVVVDSTEPNLLRFDDFRAIEEILSHYSVFFNNNSKW